jgi:hypothetical protein
MGAGLSWQAASYLSFFGSVRTDKSFRDSTRPSFVGLDHFDLHHLTAGIGIFTQSLDLWIGALYGAGDAREQLAPSPLPESLVRNATTTFEHVGFVLAFSASF